MIEVLNIKSWLNRKKIEKYLPTKEDEEYTKFIENLCQELNTLGKQKAVVTINKRK